MNAGPPHTKLLRLRAALETFTRAVRLSVLGFSIEVRALPRAEPDIDKAIQALTNASALVAELEEELAKRAGDLTRVKKDYARYSNLAATEEAKAHALLETLELSASRSRATERWVAAAINLAVGLAIFAFGLLLQRYVLPK